MDTKFYAAIENKLLAWIQNRNPSVVLLYLPKPTKKDPYPQIKYTGSPNMENFINNREVRRAFIDSSQHYLNALEENVPIMLKKQRNIRDEMPEISEKSTDFNMDNKRLLVSQLVRQFVLKTKNVKRDFWGLDGMRPDFWPSKIPFRSPNTARNSKVSGLKGEQLSEVLKSYIAWKNETETEEEAKENETEEEAKENETEEEAKENETEEEAKENETEEEAKENETEEEAKANETEEEAKENETEEEAKENETEEEAKENETEEEAKENETEEEAKENETEEEAKENETEEEAKENETEEEAKENETEEEAKENGRLDDLKREITSEHPNYSNLCRDVETMPLKEVMEYAKYLEETLNRPKLCKIDVNAVPKYRYSKLPAGFIAGQSLSQGDCLFSSVSMCLTGTNEHVNKLRLGAACHGLLHSKHYLEKIMQSGINDKDSVEMFVKSVHHSTSFEMPDFTNISQILEKVLIDEAMITLKSGAYSGYLQVMFLAGFIQRTIHQDSSQNLIGRIESVPPCDCAPCKNEEPINIFWLSHGSNTNGHVVPLFKVNTKHSRKRKYSDLVTSLGQQAIFSCAAALYNWCNAAEVSNRMIECERCHAWIHDSCFGIRNPAALHHFYCCWEDNQKFSGFPVVELGLVKNISVHLQDLVSLRPGNWLTDNIIDVFARILNEKVSSLYIFSPEVLILRRPVRQLQKLYIEKAEKVEQLLFTVVRSGHWMSVLVLKNQEDIIIIDSNKKFRHHGIVDQICRLMKLSRKNVMVETAEVQQQDNNFDCGAYTAAFMMALAKYFSGKHKKVTKHQILQLLKRVDVNITSTRMQVKTMITNNFC